MTSLTAHNALALIYNTLSEVRPGEGLGPLLQNGLDALIKLGWPAVRISVVGSDWAVLETLHHAAENCQLPNWSARTLQERLNDTLFRVGEAVFYTGDNCEQVLLPALPLLVELYRYPGLQPPVTEADMLPLMLLTRYLAALVEQEQQITDLKTEVRMLGEQVDELNFIRNADRELSSRLDPGRIVKLALDWAMRRTGADAGAIFTVNRVTNDLEIRESFGYPVEIINAPQLPWSISKGVTGKSIRERATQVVELVQADEEYTLPSTVTRLIVPLISNRLVVGVISLESSVAGRFEPDAVGFVERIAGITAIALDNAQLLEQAEQMADDMSLIYNAGRTISSSLEWDSAIQSIAQGMALAVNGTGALIYSYNSHTLRAELQSSYTVNVSPYTGPESIPSAGAIWDLSRFPRIREAIEQGSLITLYPESTTDPDELQWIQDIGTKAAAITPLTAQGQVIGIAVLLKSRPPYRYASSEIFVAESLSSQAASVLRQAMLYTEISALENLKSEMIRMASHDLRSPIANATGYLELLDMELEGSKSPDLESFMDSIRRSLKTMGNLVDNLLTLERLESQRNQPWESLNFDELISATFDEHVPAANLKKHHMRLEILPGNYAIRGHKTQLQQAVSNLIGNAIKYTPEQGEITVQVRAEGNRVHFVVVDNGYGIPEDRQSRIFQRFYRAKTPGTEHITGTGLGLSLVKTVIERHSGEVYFVSRSGEGSHFGFWLPWSRSG